MDICFQISLSHFTKCPSPAPPGLVTKAQPTEKRGGDPSRAFTSSQDVSRWRLQETFFDFNLQRLEEWASGETKWRKTVETRMKPSKAKRQSNSWSTKTASILLVPEARRRLQFWKRCASSADLNVHQCQRNHLTHHIDTDHQRTYKRGRVPQRLTSAAQG